jgi:hypothetical protein
MFMAMYGFIPHFREAKFCGVLSCVLVKVGCAVGEKKVAEHWHKALASLPFSTMVIQD